MLRDLLGNKCKSPPFGRRLALANKEPMTEHPHLNDLNLDEDARQAHSTGEAVVRQILGADGCLYDRRVEPYPSDIGGVIVTYKPCGKEAAVKDASTKSVIGSLLMGMNDLGVWTIEASTSRMDWDERFAAITGLGEPGMAALEDAIAEDDREAFKEGFQAAIQSDEPQDLEFRLASADRPVIWLQMRSQRVATIDGVMVVGIIADITERKDTAQRSDFMIRELDHRVKNLLAIILSIAEITGRSNSDIETYKNDFRARLESMARTHNQLAQAQWSGLDLRALIEEETYSLAPKTAMTIEGVGLEITPSAAQSLAMFVHELTVNALKHGALTADAGHVTVRWEVSKRPGEALQFTWAESGADQFVEPPAREGFGGKVINRIVKRQLDAQVTTDWHASGMQLTAHIPLANIVSQKTPGKFAR